MIERHLARLRLRHPISAEEEQAIRGTLGERRDYPAGSTIIHAGQLLHHSTLLLDGLMCRYKDLPGGQRQIAELHVPGDFADLHSYTLKRLDHNIMALTACRIVMVPHKNIRELVRAHPRLGDVYWFSTNLDAAVHRELALSLGQRSALSRTAALICELQLRLGVVGLATEAGFAFDLTQTVLGECLGITSVHVNRTLRELRERGLMSLRNKQVVIQDLAGLRAIAQFDPAYLYLRPDPL